MNEEPSAPDAAHPPDSGGLGGVVRSVVIFAIAYVLGEWLLTLAGASGVLQPLSELTARITLVLSVATGVPATLAGIDVVLPQRILRVGLDCTGAYVFVAYAALVLAQPVSWRARWVGVALGLPALAALNIVRLVLVAHVAHRTPTYFDLLHDFLFQGVMILVALVVWLAWLAYATRAAPTPATSPAEKPDRPETP